MSQNEKSGTAILVVDDDEGVLNTVRRILEDHGYSVITADSGLACLDVLESGFTGLILMDIVMPDMDGWSTIREIVERGYSERTIICMLSGRETPDHDVEHLKEHVVDYIAKPFKSETLISVVQQYLSFIN